MSLALSIAGEEFSIVASAEVLGAVAERYAPFLTEGPGPGAPLPPIRIEVACRPGCFAPAYERPVEGEVRYSAPDAITLEGAVRGRYGFAARRGSIDEATGVGAVDALLRVALSAALPLAGGLLLHGAAIRDAGGGGLALCGASGAGKSTAAAAFGAFCDELVVIRPAGDILEVHSTPYWGGRPHRLRCAGVLCLKRGGEPGLVGLRGAAAARALARHVVRYAAVETIDRAVFDLLCLVGARGDVRLASCPEGSEFIPFLRARLGLEEAAA
jgi:hypothetical protein